MTSPSKITTQDLIADSIGYERLAKFFEETLGLRFDLIAQNRPLFCSRFAQLMNDFGLGSFEDLLRHLNSNQENREDLVFKRLIHSATTHTTEFFRDPTHFDFLRVWFRQRLSGKSAELKALAIDPDKKKLRIWCAAASTGEEPISVLMTLLDIYPEIHQQLNLEILATDVDEEVLKNAEAGFYDEKDLKAVSREQLDKYFVPIEKDAVIKSYRVKPRITGMVEFRVLNLAEPDFTNLGQFDLILCRNVLIYFPEALAQQAISAMIRALLPGGVFILDDVDPSGLEKQNLQRLLPGVFAMRQ